MIVEVDSPIECWRTSTRQLLAQGNECFNLTATFAATAAEDESEMLKYDPAGPGLGGGSIADVANTIFPRKTYENWKNSDTGRLEFYKRYKRAHRRARNKRWGTYFLRFIEFGESKANQLETLIEARTLWPNNYKAALYMHTTSIEIGRPQPLGGPCLQYVQFCCRKNNVVDLVAVYRNHDYFNKALGNYFGLARLLSFFCDESRGEKGTVTCIGIHAYFDKVGRQKRLAQL